MWAGIKRGVAEMARSESPLLPAIAICTLSAFGLVCLSSTHLYLMEQSVCRKHYTLFEPARIGNGGLMDEETCKIPEIQAEVARMHGIFNFVNYLPALFLTGPYGKISKVLGKKTIMFLNVSSLAFGGVYFTAVCYFWEIFDIQWIYLMPLLDAIGGGSVIMSSFTYTFISESVDSRNLSSVLYKLSAGQLMVAFSGMSLSSYLLRRNIWIQCLIGIAILTATVPITLLFPESNACNKTYDSATPCRYSDSDEEAAQESLESNSLILHTMSADSTLKSVLITIVQELITHKTHSLSLFKSILYASPFFRETMFTYFILMLGHGIRVIFTQWGSITYTWRLADINALSSFEMMLSGVMLMLLPIITARFLKPRLGGSTSSVDLFMTKASVLAAVMGVICMGFAPTKAAYVAAVIIWTMGCGLTDSLRGFVTSKTECKDAVEELYLGIGMVETFGGMIATAFWSGLFSNVLGMSYWVSRIPFMLSSVILLGVFGCVCVLVKYNKASRTTEVDD